MRDNDLPEFLERALGVIEQGVRASGDHDYQIVLHRDGKFHNLSTLGLSHHSLASSTSSKLLRIELVTHLPFGAATQEYVGLLAGAVERCIELHAAVLRGDALAIGGGNSWAGLYFTLPIFLPEDFWQFDLRSVQGALVLALPVKAVEIDFIRRVGWEAWEDILDERGDEVFDPSRKAFV